MEEQSQAAGQAVMSAGATGHASVAAAAAMRSHKLEAEVQVRPVM